jgi:hypothetical protein
MTNIFDGKGRIRADVLVPEDRRAQYHALVAAQAACETAESNEKAADQKVDACVRIHNDVLARIPKQTITSLVKETFNLP